MATVPFSIRAALQEFDTTTTTGTFAFVRSLGFVWGINTPAIIFKARFDALACRIRSIALPLTLANGKTYGYASARLIKALPQNVRADV